jgi:hypothetical protein
MNQTNATLDVYFWGRAALVAVGNEDLKSSNWTRLFTFERVLDRHERFLQRRGRAVHGDLSND